MRSVPPEEQEELRRQAVRQVQSGRTQSEVARALGVTRASVNRWIGYYRSEGDDALKSRPRGRPRREKLTAADIESVFDTLVRRRPEDFGWPAVAWTRSHVEKILADEYDIVGSRWTVMRTLASWGLAVPSSKSDDRRLASRPGSQTYSLQESALPSGRRLVLLSAIGGRGEHSFLVFSERSHASNVIELLERLRRQTRAPLLVVTAPQYLVRGETFRRWLDRAGRQKGIHVTAFAEEKGAHSGSKI